VIIIVYSFTSKELEELDHDTAVRANHEAAFEPNKSGLKGKPHVFELAGFYYYF
jgi:hypothetical protein